MDLEEVIGTALVAGHALHRASDGREFDQPHRTDVKAGAGFLVSLTECGRRDIRDHECFGAAIAVLGNGISQRKLEEHRKIGRDRKEKSVALARVILSGPPREGGAPCGVLKKAEHSDKSWR